MTLPSAATYRTYKVVKGKIVPLKDTFIQRRSMRLMSPGEVREIPLIGARASAKARAERKAAGIKVKYNKSKKVAFI